MSWHIDHIKVCRAGDEGSAKTTEAFEQLEETARRLTQSEA